MKLIVKPSRSLHGTIDAPPSKSLTHRAVIVASLADGKSGIRGALISEDTLASMEACKAIGAEIEVKDADISVEGVDGKPKPPEKTIDVRNSGTTLRIMTAVSSLCNGRVSLTGDESIKKRPMQPLLTALEQLGVEASSMEGRPPVTVRGPMQGGKCSIRGDVSSQFISGLLIATPLAVEDTWIKVTSNMLSKPYLDLTLNVMHEFNVEIEAVEGGFHTEGGQTYKARNYSIEGDYSSAAFILAAAALTESEVTVGNLQENSRQGDKKIIHILREMGASVNVTGNEVRIRGGGLHGVDLDMSDTPDLVPITAVLASLADGKTVIRNVSHLRYKESDRLKAVSTELARMGALIKAVEDGLEVKGVDSLRGVEVSGWNDHRIVMSLAVAGLRAEGETTIDSAESMDVSFPGFVDVLRTLGADVFSIG